tara:strand:+ start:792 stop:1490 length:699 start_codon:yes stop_codon:yes gene_type:complete
MDLDTKNVKISIIKKKHFNWKFLEKINDIENVIDIGANIGTPQLIYNFPNANYYYFEPLKNCNQELNKFNKKNNISNYQIFNVALSNKIGEALFNEVGDTSSHSSSLLELSAHYDNTKKKLETVKIKVELDVLSNFKDKVNFNNSFIKMDTQGSEFDILQGIDNEIFEKVKFFLIEISFVERYEKQSNFDEIYSYLKEKNYKLAGIVELNNQLKASQADFLFCKKDDNRSYF